MKVKSEYEFRKGLEQESRKHSSQLAFARFLGVHKDALNRFLLGRGLSDALASKLGIERVYRKKEK